MRTRFVTALFTALVVAVASAGQAWAGERPDGSGGAFVDSGGAPTAVAKEGGSGGGDGGSGGGGSGSTDPCEWRVVIEDDFEFAIYDVDSLETQHSATGRWLERWCPGIGAVDVNGFFVVPEGGLVDPYQLALDALASVQIAPPTMSTSKMKAMMKRLIMR